MIVFWPEKTSRAPDSGRSAAKLEYTPENHGAPAGRTVRARDVADGAHDGDEIDLVAAKRAGLGPRASTIASWASGVTARLASPASAPSKS